MERLWRSGMYEAVYLRAYSDGWEAELPIRSILSPITVPPARG
jgi:hypothetical protein